MNELDCTLKHGKKMYNLALEHAIYMFEIAGEDALPKLKNRIGEVKQEIKEVIISRRPSRNTGIYKIRSDLYVWQKWIREA